MAKNQQQLNDILFVDTSSITKVILKEIDDNEPCLDYNGSKYKRYLSIKDYGINDGAYISIQYKQHVELQINTNKFSIKGKLIKNYHLIKPNEAYSSSLTSSASSSSSSSTSAICKKLDDDDNVKLTRLLLIKGTLQPFVDDLFETLFTNTANLSPVIKHLFDYFDQEFRKA